jgi:hypothetical protein
LAGALAAHVMLLLVRVWRHGSRHLVAPAVVLAALLVGQLVLGGGTWVLKYNWPGWLSDFAFAQDNVVTPGSFAQTWVTTAHVAAGSLLFGVSLVLSLRALRLLRDAPRAARQPAGFSMEVVR